jgi:DNA-binding MarR family transcriptional regulator
LSPGRCDCDTSGDATALEIVLALDRIFDSLMSVIPIEGAGMEIPLTPSEVRAARRMPMSGAVGMRALASSLGVSLPAATHIVDRLVEKGVVVRTRPQHDRRVVLVELSESSKQCRLKMCARRAGLIQRTLEPLGASARAEFARLLGELADAASSHETALRGTV